MPTVLPPNNNNNNNNNNAEPVTATTNSTGFSFTALFSRLVKSVGGGGVQYTPPPVTLYKVIYSVYPPGKLYQTTQDTTTATTKNDTAAAKSNRNLPLTGSQKERAGHDVIFTEYHDYHANLKAPAFSDGFKKFFPMQMQNGT